MPNLIRDLERTLKTTTNNGLRPLNPFNAFWKRQRDTPLRTLLKPQMKDLIFKSSCGFPHNKGIIKV